MIVFIVMIGLSLIKTNASSAAVIVRTSDMIPNEAALAGMQELVNLIGKSAINITPLKNTLKKHELHQEGPEAAMLFLASGDEGVTFLPKFPRFTLYNGFLGDCSKDSASRVSPARLV